MRKFKINVNDKSYEVEVEELKDGAVSTPAAAPAPVQAAQKVATTQAPKAAPAAPVTIPAGAATVTAPMPGTILSINVKAGDSVKKGQVLCILEAMKMENEIMSGADATVTSIAISQGDSVNTGQVLFILG